MTDSELMLRAVLDDPADDLKRLVYADALEEAGECDRAEFVRLDVALDSSRSPFMIKTPDGLLSSEMEAIHRRRELLDLYPLDDPDLSTVTWRRGMVEGLAVSAEDFMPGACRYCRGRGWVPARDSHDPCDQCGGTGQSEGAAGLFSRHPITKVTLVGKTPWLGDSGLVAWFVEGLSVPADDTLPRSLFELLLGYAAYPGQAKCRVYLTEADAFAALSAACVNYGRGLAGLKRLGG